MNDKLTKIKDRVVDTMKDIVKKDKDGKEFKGIVTRKDILDVLNACADPKKEKENVSEFLDSLPEEMLDFNQKQKILNDLDSYKVDYKRK